MGFEWVILDASDANSPHKAVSNSNYVRMGVYVKPIHLSLSIFYPMNERVFSLLKHPSKNTPSERMKLE